MQRIRFTGRRNTPSFLARHCNNFVGLRYQNKIIIVIGFNTRDRDCVIEESRKVPLYQQTMAMQCGRRVEKTRSSFRRLIPVEAELYDGKSYEVWESDAYYR